ncbi:type I restriction-modification system DNA methylase subunit [Planomicrobium koreense]|uniref:Type I restriction-modification system DNA methylase subunit n=1 Tax=Planococcus koreensis TaxID=112331 RepID=A0A7W8CTL0_9BACL|nr:type I restriction-modification system DNA methylase subunit [Planococcus koreensis]
MTNNTANVGFEETLWKAADKLRGSMDSGEYKHVVLGLIFLKYISDKFETKYNELVEEGSGFEEDIDEYTAENIFWVPTEARWDFIKDHGKDVKNHGCVPSVLRGEKSGLKHETGGCR